MDLSSNWDLPNPFGLLAADFNHDMDSYRACLGFLGDYATGSDHDAALADNGGSAAMLIGWKRLDKFRRVYEKCRKANAEERRYAAEQAKAEEEAEGEPTGSSAGDGDGGGEPMVAGSFSLRLQPPPEAYEAATRADD